MDSAGGAAGPAGVAASAHVPGARAHALEESDSGSLGALQHSDFGCDRRVWRGRQTALGRAPGGAAATYPAKCGTGAGNDGFYGAANRGGEEAIAGPHESSGRG